ncbi:MAG: glycosyl transferase family 1 [Rubrivivax sp. SCN 71-131]|nr:MAG: glycosyl transferase family 1 [Rubrivivax sp. SCN 71-131]
MAEPHLGLLGDATSPHVRRWAGEMIARGWRVSLVTARPAPIDGVEQRVLSPVRRASDWLLRRGEAARAIAALAPDIVHAHYVTSYGFLAAVQPRRPCVLTAWGSDLLVTPRHSALLRALTRWTLRRADLVTGDAEELLAISAAMAPRVPRELLHWGVDLARFVPPPRRAAPEPFTIVSLRSWSANYRIDTIVRAVAALAATRPVTLHLLGGGEDEAALRALVAALGLGACTRFHGRVDDATMVDVMQRGHVSVSVPASDATSVSVLESMACGLPVLASDLPANRRWLDADPLQIVAGGDVAALAAALATLADDPARAGRIAAAQLDRIRREGSRALQMDHMDRLYRGLLERRR